MTSRKITSFLGMLSSILIVVSFAGCGATRTAKGQVSNIQVREEPELINGAPDWGAKVTFNVTNVGAAGEVQLNVKLTCSEGEWSRTQNLHFQPQQSMSLSYFFQEPTINATNIQAQVSVNP